MTLRPCRFAFALLGASACLATESQPINLWSGQAPGEKGGLPAEHDTTQPTDGAPGGKLAIHLADVSTPTLTLYRPLPYKDTGTTVVVCPGGGYYILVMDLEGTEVCDWLNSIGVNAVLVKYRVPRREGRDPSAAPLQDAQRAFVLVRSHAKEWGLDPGRIGVLGFSAGGDLSARLSASTTRTYPRFDAADDLSFHPNFQILIYPAYLVKDGARNALDPGVAVTAFTPPTFLVMTEDDGNHVENVLYYALALKDANIPMELHVYPTGGHGYGLRPVKDYVTTWPARAADWMRSRGLLDAR
jgi:acetyl esterase/lipase